MPEFIPEHTPADLDDFTRGYLECAEWLLDDSDDNEYGESDKNRAEGFSLEAIEQAETDCLRFQNAYADLLILYGEFTERDMGSAGHDFWLTRNGHGAGFWDRQILPSGSRGAIGKDALNELTEAANIYGSCDVYVGDDGLIYFT